MTGYSDFVRTCSLDDTKLDETSVFHNGKWLNWHWEWIDRGTPLVYASKEALWNILFPKFKSAPNVYPFPWAFEIIGETEHDDMCVIIKRVDNG